MKERKILILGGAEAQLQLIKAAKKEGYYVVLCDWTTTNPGIKIADKHYQVSTLDLDEIRKIVEYEKIEGVISNSEPAMENVAIIAHEFGLVGNPVNAIRVLNPKFEFRKLQEECDIFSPKNIKCSEISTFLEKMKNMQFPVIIKPNLSSGSRGTTYIELYKESEIINAFDKCKKISLDKYVVCEEYVEHGEEKSIEADFFIHNGIIIKSGIFTVHAPKDFPFLTLTGVFPADLTEEEKKVFCNTTEKLLKTSGFVHGEVNVEGYFTKEGRLFIVEINVRQAGLMVPQVIADHTGIDMTRLLITTCMRDDYYFEQTVANTPKNNLITTHVLMSRKKGYLKKIQISSQISENVYKIISKPLGTYVEYGSSFKEYVGKVFLQYDNREVQLSDTKKMNELVQVLVSDIL